MARAHRAAAWLLLLTGLPLAAAGFTPSGFGASNGGGQLVAEDEVRRDAQLSFNTAVDAMQRRHSDTAGAPFDVAAAVAARREAFGQALDTTLLDLLRDGLLTSDEVSAAVGELSQQRLDDMAAMLQAAAAGHPAPPVPWSGAAGGAAVLPSGLAFAGALTGYVFTVRNHALDWLALLACVVGGALLAWLGSRALQLLRERLDRHGLTRSSELAAGMTAPLYLALTTAGLATGLGWIWLPLDVGAFVRGCVDSALTLAVYWFLWNACAPLAGMLLWTVRTTYADGAAIDSQAYVVLRRSLRVVLALAFLLLLVRWVWDTDFATLFAGFGLLGLALTLVLRSMVQNIFASFTIFAEKHFQVGDVLVFEEQWGTVEDVGFRSTAFRTFDGHLLHIPNQTLVDGVIHNVSARPAIRRRTHLHLSHRDAPEALRRALDTMRGVLEAQPPAAGWLEEHPPRVVLEDLGPWDARVLLQYHHQPPDYWQALEYDTATNLRLLEALAEQGITLAFPTESEERLEPLRAPRQQAQDAGTQRNGAAARQGDGDDDEPEQVARDGEGG